MSSLRAALGGLNQSFVASVVDTRESANDIGVVGIRKLQMILIQLPYGDPLLRAIRHALEHQVIAIRVVRPRARGATGKGRINRVAPYGVGRGEGGFAIFEGEDDRLSLEGSLDPARVLRFRHQPVAPYVKSVRDL